MSDVAIQGIRGSYSYEAAMAMLGSETKLIECDDFAAAFAAVKNGRASGAIVPLRNKIVGEVRPVADLLGETGFTVSRELKLQIDHVLAGTVGADIEDINLVRSHPEALKQCKRYFSANPHITAAAFSDTASSIRDIVRNNIRQHAAIGSAKAAELFGATILDVNISDDENNWTTFGLVENCK